MKNKNIEYETNSIIDKAYRMICANKQNYGTFHKCLFHLHTAASYDYAVLEEYRNANDDTAAKIFKDFTEEEIYDLCIKNKVFGKEFSLDIIDKSQNEEFEIFADKKEAMIYLLIALKLCENNIELVLISDHNTIRGYDKLEKAIFLTYKAKSFAVYPELILGIEISCADKNHVVGIFENTHDIKEKINNWITKHVMSEKDGTFSTSLEVIKWIQACGGLPYIAHINSSDMFKQDKFLTGAYKKKLFNLPFFHVVGLSDKTKQDIIEEKLKEYSSQDFCYVLDSDSHSIDTIGEKIFWIKGSRRSFNMIKDAFRDYSISIEYENPKAPESYIKGILVKNSEDGFLTNREGNAEFCLSFSEALNCFIGGRGTGKSTTLKILEVVLRQNFGSKEMLEAICEYPAVWLLFCYKDEEYLISFLSPKKTYQKESFAMYFDKKRDYNFGQDFEDTKGAITNYTLENYIEIYKLKTDYKPIQYIKIKNGEKRKYLNKFFHRGYSVNELVQTASSDTIHDYILHTMKFDENLVSTHKKFKSMTGLEKFLSGLEETLKQRKMAVLKEIVSFNARQDKKLRITYYQKADDSSLIDFKKIMEYGRVNKDKMYYRSYNISLDGVVDFLYQACKKMTTAKFFLLLIQKKYKEINEKCDIKGFCNDYTQKMINDGIAKIEEKNVDDVIALIRFELIEDYITLDKIIQSFRNYISEVETFGLDFNVYNKEDVAQHLPLYKNIKLVSLGQKVVAMLSFILAYSDFSHDYRPLIIDQPEDNLDNRYIYRNLVADLREVKTKRQVIIATHNATIVTNAKADQVVVLDSDGSHGWILARGFPTESKIKSHIVNYLEGGVNSFKHKCFIYDEILKQN